MTAPKTRAGPKPPEQKERAGLNLLLLSLAIGPAAWIVQLAGDYALASHACRPNGAPRLAPPAGGWGGEHLVLLGLNLVCLGFCLAGGGVAFAYWRNSHREKPAAAPEPISVGQGRTRFLAACGMIAAVAFAIAIGFDTTLPFFVPSCWRFAS
jgi:hypothetical protein